MYIFNASTERTRPYIHEIPPPSYDNPLTMRRSPSANLSLTTKRYGGDHHPFDPLAWMPGRSSCRVHAYTHGDTAPLTKVRAACLRPPSTPATPPTAPKPAPSVVLHDLAELRSATPSTAEALERDGPRRDHVRTGSQILAAATSSRRSSRRPSFSESLASAAATECATPPRSEPVPLQVHRPIALKFATSI